MRSIISIFILLMPAMIFAQRKNDSLVTSIGWVINKGDTITLGLGSMPDGGYKYIQISEAASFGDEHLSNRYSGKSFEVFKIKVFRGRQVPVIKYGNSKLLGQRWDVEIEGAIANNEIVVPEKFRKKQDAPPASASKADEIAKLKKLLDDGALTKEEFEAEKKKILNK